MYNPKDEFTAEQLEEHKAHLFNMKQAVFWLLNNDDDLHLPTVELETIHKLGRILDDKVLENGDGETREDD